MRNPHPVDHALRSGFGMALLAALALVQGCAPEDAIEDEEEQSVEPSSAEAADELQLNAPVGHYRCTVNGGLIPATMVAYPGPWGRSTCAIFAPVSFGSSNLFCTGSGIFMTCPDCRDLQASLACPYRAPRR